MPKLSVLLVALAICGASGALGAVFINEIFINPPGSDDDTREFIELLGTPGMKLDGYAVALVNGTQQKYYPLGSIPPVPVVAPEVDELFSLDGLSLGANGILVLGVGVQSRYPTLLTDSNFQRWNTLWNGGLDTTGKLDNDGSNTIFLLRNRPGRTQANPNDPAGLRWGKDIPVDNQLFTPVIDPQTGQPMDQYGDGDLDSGLPTGFGGNTLDLLGATTPEATDNLEIVDEVSYEHDRGWEYDTDPRHVDDGSADPALPRRHVHSLDDPQGFNPDVLTRVDYRTSGPGWTPAQDGVGELPSGNNWQDTATEQWIRGDSQTGTFGEGASPFYYYTAVPYADPNNPGVQPYQTNVPHWLADGVAPDFSFAVVEGSAGTERTNYQIMAGRINPLAVPFIPGDANRDGVCNPADIALLQQVFGADDIERVGTALVYHWIYGNADPNSPLTGVDPATTIKPWDVNLTGDNGIECSDLQWVLNFQGDAGGRIVGRRYDSTTPAATGVYLNPNTGVACTLSASASATSVAVGQTVDVTISGAVTAGANAAAGQQNGIMQVINDVTLSGGGVFKVVSVTPLGAFTSIESDPTFQAKLGVDGDLGIRNANGFSTSFQQGLGATAPLYAVRLLALAPGSVNLSIAPAGAAKFVASTPFGVKVGHTASNGNPASAAYPAPLTLTATSGPVLCAGDSNCDGVVDFADIDPFVEALSYSGGAGWPHPNCPWLNSDCNGDHQVDFSDIDPFVARIGAACP